MTITFSVAVQSPVAAKPATIDARQLASFRRFARDQDHLVDATREGLDDPLPYAFEARISPWSMASISALFDHDPEVISVIEEAQFRGLNIRFWKCPDTHDLKISVSRTLDGSDEMNPSTANAYALLEDLGFGADTFGSVDLQDLARRMAQPDIRARLSDRGHSRYLDQLDCFARQSRDTEETRLVWV